MTIIWTAFFTNTWPDRFSIRYVAICWWDDGEMWAKEIVSVSFLNSTSLASFLMKSIFSSRVRLSELLDSHHRIGQRSVHLSNAWLGISRHLLSTTWSRSDFRRCWRQWWLLLLQSWPLKPHVECQCNVFNSMVGMASDCSSVCSRRLFNIWQRCGCNIASFWVQKSFDFLLRQGEMVHALAVDWVIEMSTLFF